MDKVKIIQMGIGSVGMGITRVLSRNKGIEIVGAIDTDKKKVGKDIGEVADLNQKLGVIITDDADGLFSKVHADVIIHTTAVRRLPEVFQEIKKPISEGMNLITAHEEAADPFMYDPVIAAELEKLTRLHGVTFLGSGSLQATDRLILFLTEQCNAVHRIRFIAHRDVSQFAPESNRLAFGIGLSLAEYNKIMGEADSTGKDLKKGELESISNRMGWRLDEITLKIDPLINDDDLVIGDKKICRGLLDGDVKIEMEYIALLDPEHKYYHKIFIEGVPDVDACINYSQERALQGTIGPLVNAIPHVINAKPGILKALDMVPSFTLQGDVRQFLMSG